MGEWIGGHRIGLVVSKVVGARRTCRTRHRSMNTSRSCWCAQADGPGDSVLSEFDDILFEDSMITGGTG